MGSQLGSFAGIILDITGRDNENLPMNTHITLQDVRLAGALTSLKLCCGMTATGMARITDRIPKHFEIDVALALALPWRCA